MDPKLGTDVVGLHLSGGLTPADIRTPRGAQILLKKIEIKARGAEKAEFTCGK